MTGQAINENSIDDFTKEELVIIGNALRHYASFVYERDVKLYLKRYSNDEHYQEVQQLRHEVISKIN